MKDEQHTDFFAEIDRWLDDQNIINTINENGFRENLRESLKVVIRGAIGDYAATQKAAILTLIEEMKLERIYFYEEGNRQAALADLATRIKEM
jgi:hypothetical protein